MFRESPPVLDVSRSRLQALTSWIRDELDPLVAREGASVLRPDDVVILHEMFAMLRQAPGITALDLRATGIHRAIQDIAGVATRWPGRLCDDCDRIISLWKAKFGPLDQLHPFLCGRHGRLEGIASVAEYSPEALLKRWSQTCPDKIHPRQSHRPGNLGFRAGDWWINTLFAYHAGIIGIEAVDGGTTFDKNGAYALMLEYTGESTVSSENFFTHRMQQSDRGRFRLTAATARSREPIRVLRSHSMNSIRGPKAGIRYEGLYRVAGWSIHTARSSDTIGGDIKEGELIYDIKFERADDVPMAEVIKRPTASEVDDYSEYKRLRKLHRGKKHKSRHSSESPVKVKVHHGRPTTLIATPASLTSMVNSPEMTPQAPSNVPRKSIIWNKRLEMPPQLQFQQWDTVSPKTVPKMDSFPLVPLTPSKSIAIITTVANDSQLYPDPTDTSPQAPSAKPSRGNSTHSEASIQTILKKTAPWMEFGEGKELATAHGLSQTLLIARKEGISKTLGSRVGTETEQASNTHSDDLSQPPASGYRPPQKKSIDLRTLDASPTLNSLKSQTSRKSIFIRTKNPIAKLFDGVASEDENEDYFGNAIYNNTRTIRTQMEEESQHQTPPKCASRPDHRSETNESPLHFHSPVPIRPASSVPLRIGRRDAISQDEDSPLVFPSMPLAAARKADVSCLSESQNDAFIDAQSGEEPVLLSLHQVMARLDPLCRNASAGRTPDGSGIGTVQIGKESGGELDVGAAAPSRRGDGLDDRGGAEVRVLFENPFDKASGDDGFSRQRKHGKEKSLDVAPDEIV